MRLDGKAVMITGAARGLGRACALAFAREGADLLLVDICKNIPSVPYPLGTASQLEHTEQLCRDIGAAVVVAEVDVRDSASVESAVEAAQDRFGRIDVLVNNAGIVAPSGMPADKCTETEWQLMIDINLTGAWRLMRAVAPQMVARRAGSIINVSSTAGLVGYRHFAGYVTSKHGLIGLTKAAALDYAPTGVRVNALCPGSVRDDHAVEGRMLAEISRALAIPVEGAEDLFRQEQPMDRLIEPEDVAAAALWFASDESRHVTGSLLTVDAGFTAR